MVCIPVGIGQVRNLICVCFSLRRCFMYRCFYACGCQPNNGTYHFCLRLFIYHRLGLLFCTCCLDAPFPLLTILTIYQGIAFAIIVFAPTSGGHFNPAVTLCLAFWQGFPWRKVPYYIFSQILGAFLAGLMVMGQYRQQIVAFTEGSIALGHGTVYNGGPASIFCSFPLPTQSLGYLFFIEFFVDSFIVSHTQDTWPSRDRLLTLSLKGSCHLGSS